MNPVKELLYRYGLVHHQRSREAHDLARELIGIETHLDYLRTAYPSHYTAHELLERRAVQLRRALDRLGNQSVDEDAR